jgi:hypothetical protein
MDVEGIIPAFARAIEENHENVSQDGRYPS